jgi:hypothetical protein
MEGLRMTQLHRVGAFNVRLVREGERYGRRDCLTHDKPRTLIEFYDTRHSDPDYPDGRGQFVTRYYLQTLASDYRRRAPDHGLDMHGGVPSWKLTSLEVSDALAWALEQERVRHAET